MHGIPQGSHGHTPWRQQPQQQQQQQQPSGYAMAGAAPPQQQQQQQGWGGADGQLASDGGVRVHVKELVPTLMVTRIIGKVTRIIPIAHLCTSSCTTSCTT